MFAHLKILLYYYDINRVITLHNVSQFTEFWVSVRLTDDGCQQPKHVAVDWCQVYVLVCASCWSYEL